MMENGAIRWPSKRQATIALSSTEVEHMAEMFTTKEALWLQQLFKDLGFPQQVTAHNNFV